MRITSLQGRSALLAASLLFALTACSGTSGGQGPAGPAGIAGPTGSTGATGATGASGLDGGLAPKVTTGISIVIRSAAVTASGVSVTFDLLDDLNQGVDVLGVYSVNTAIKPRFSIGKVVVDSTGQVLPLQVLSVVSGAPSAFDPSKTGQGTLVDSGARAGRYTYTFPASVVISPTSTDTYHLWIEAKRQTDLVNSPASTFYATSQRLKFIPSGAGTPLDRQLVTAAACNACHDGNKAEKLVGDVGYHGNARSDGEYCNVCHNPARSATADSAVFVHRIHDGKNIWTNSLFHGLEATYPADIRSCDTCHGGAAQGGQAMTRQTRAACGSCHDNVNFAAAATTKCTIPNAVDATGAKLPCDHKGGAQADDSNCSLCHMPGGLSPVADLHVPVVEADPCNTFSYVANGNVMTAGCAAATNSVNSRTNAGWLAGSNYLPTGAKRVTAIINAVGTDSGNHPKMEFKFQVDGVDAVFQDPASFDEILPNFVGAPLIYFAFGAPQDGITSPNDYNFTSNINLKTIWAGNATSGTGAATLTYAAPYYTVTFTGIHVPSTDTILTGAIGYLYQLTWDASAKKIMQPLTQTNLLAYPYDAAKRTGGLIVPFPNVWKTADGKAGRRTIVSNARCQSCHVQLGVSPTFHVGQRNDGPSCALCHNPNRTSNGWAANSKDFIHAIHAGGFVPNLTTNTMDPTGRGRTVPFMWAAVSATDNFSEVGFPSRLNACQACHEPDTYDFSASASATALPNLLWSTAATGNTAANFKNSPYMVAGFNYGSGYSYAADTNVATAAGANTLVTSPVTAACVACHDSVPAWAHMQANGGSFYALRSAAIPTTPTNGEHESCLLCHGKGAYLAIDAVH